MTAGEVKVFGRPARIASPRAALALGIGFCSEDRKEEGLFLDHSLAFNLTITELRPVLRAGLISFKKEALRAGEYIDRLRIRPMDPARRAATLSGGAQQKTVLAKWLQTSPRLLIMDEPTRGIDVGAKVEIYQILDRFVAQGGAVLLISSDLPELMALSDRILVMHEGTIAGECVYPDFNPETIMALATGIGSRV
jgi:ABC-type sugar transport system ATPase subunit